MTKFIATTTGLTRRFGKITAVSNLNLNIPQSSVYAFLGPNGAGKTTTIRMLLGLIRPDAGDVSLFGQSLKRNRLALLEKVGSLVESPSLYPHLTGQDNLEVVRRMMGANKSQVAQVLDTVRLKEAAKRPVGTYSLGMKQRLGLAVALLNNPALLILDEPTNGLDPAGILEMRELMTRLAQEQGLTVFLSSHLLSEVEQVATHIGVVENGRLRFQGTVQDLHAQVEEHVVLKVQQPKSAQKLLQQSGWTVKHNGNSRLAVKTNSTSDAALINRQLVENGLNVYHLQLEQPTLEDIFLTLTNEK